MPVFTPGTPVETADAVIAVEGLAPGTHRFRLEVEDESGNRSAADERIVSVRPAVPVIDGFRPGFGAWGDEVVVVGRGFDPEPRKNQVVFNDGVLTDVIDGSATGLRVRVPQPATTGPVIVRNGAGEAKSPQPFIIPVAFTIGLGGPGPVDLAFEPKRGELWVLHSLASPEEGVVSVLGLRVRDLLATIPVQRGPREIAIAPPVQRQTAIVSNGIEGTVSVIDVDSRRLRQHVRVDPNPHGVAFHPEGRIAYVVCAGEAATRPGSVNVIDTASLQVIVRIAVGRAPERVVFSPDGKFAFVNDTADGTVSMIDAGAHRLVNRIRVGGSPESKPAEVAVSPDTFPLFTANPGTRTASVVREDLAAKDVDAGFAVSAAAICARTRQAWLAGPDEKVVMVADPGDGSLKKLRGGGPGGGPKNIVATGDGRGVFVANPATDGVTVYDAGSLQMMAVVRVPAFPTRGVVAEDDTLVCFICAKADSVVVVEVRSVLA